MNLIPGNTGEGKRQDKENGHRIAAARKVRRFLFYIMDCYGGGPMRLIINGNEEDCAVPNLDALVASKGLRRESLVIELNGAIIKQEHWQATGLADGDRVELLNFVGGG